MIVFLFPFIKLQEQREEQATSPTTTIANIDEEETTQINDFLLQAQDTTDQTTSEIATSTSTEEPITTNTDVPRYKRKTYKSVGYSWYREG